MAVILDTNALSALADGDSILHSAIQHERDLALPVVVLGEYLFGIRRSRLRASYETWLRSQLSIFRILPIGTETAAQYADIRLELKTVGRPIPTNDLWIAALCREYGSAVVSRDRHFTAIRGLRVVYW